MTAFLSALVVRYLRPLARRLRPEHGLEAVEYALIGALIVAILAVAGLALRTEIGATLDFITEQLGAAGPIGG